MEYSLIKAKLSKGWSYSSKRSRLDAMLEELPDVNVRLVHYFHHVGENERGGVLSVAYSGKSALIDEDSYEITIDSVSSEYKNMIETQLLSKVLSEIREWIRGVESASMTERDMRHTLNIFHDRGNIEVKKEVKF